MLVDGLCTVGEECTGMTVPPEEPEFKCEGRTEYKDGGCLGRINKDQKQLNKCEFRYGNHGGKMMKCRLNDLGKCEVGEECKDQDCPDIVEPEECPEPEACPPITKKEQKWLQKMAIVGL